MARSRITSRNASTVLLTSILVPSLLLCALILSAVGTAGKTWTHRVEFALAGDSVECKGINHRGPFQYCFLEERDDIATPPTSTASAEEEIATGTQTASSSAALICPTSQADSRYRQRCTRTNNPNGVCPNFPRNAETISRNPSTNDSTPFCQQLNISAALLIAGCALIGIGLLASLILCGASLMQVFGNSANTPKTTPLNGMLSYAASIITGLGSLAMLFGTIIGANVLVNLQFPAGIWYGGSADALNASLEGPWLIGRSVGIATAGWVCAAVAACLIGKVWPASPSPYQQVCHDNVQVEEVRQSSKGRNVE